MEKFFAAFIGAASFVCCFFLIIGIIVVNAGAIIEFLKAFALVAACVIAAIAICVLWRWFTNRI